MRRRPSPGQSVSRRGGSEAETAASVKRHAGRRKARPRLAVETWFPPRTRRRGVPAARDQDGEPASRTRAGRSALLHSCPGSRRRSLRRDPFGVHVRTFVIPWRHRPRVWESCVPRGLRAYPGARTGSRVDLTAGFGGSTTARCSRCSHAETAMGSGFNVHVSFFVTPCTALSAGRCAGLGDAVGPPQRGCLDAGGRPGAAWAAAINGRLSSLQWQSRERKTLPDGMRQPNCPHLAPVGAPPPAPLARHARAGAHLGESCKAFASRQPTRLEPASSFPQRRTAVR